jgi:hypothetical protein
MDYYKIREDWEQYKTLTQEFELEYEKFSKKPTSHIFCTRARKKLKEIEQLGSKIRSNVKKKTQDYLSDYS